MRAFTILILCGLVAIFDPEHALAKPLPSSLALRIKKLGYRVLERPVPIDVGSLVVPGRETDGGHFQSYVFSNLVLPSVETKTLALKKPVCLMRLVDVDSFIHVSDSLHLTEKDKSRYLICRGLIIRTLRTQGGLSGASFIKDLSADCGLPPKTIMSQPVVTSTISLDVELEKGTESATAAGISSVLRRTVWAYRAGVPNPSSVENVHYDTIKTLSARELGALAREHRATDQPHPPLLAKKLPARSPASAVLSFVFPELATVDQVVPLLASIPISDEVPFIWKSQAASTVRIPHLEVPSHLPHVTGNTFEVAIYADAQQPAEGETVEPIQLPDETNVNDLPVSVWLTTSEHFRVLGQDQGIIVIRRQQPVSSKMVFKLAYTGASLSSSKPSILAQFSYRGRPAGSVQRTINISTNSLSDVSSTPVTIDGNAKQPDVSIFVSNPSKDNTHLKCRVQIPALEKYKVGVDEDWTLPGPTGKIVDQTMQSLAGSSDPQSQIILLRGVGMTLFEALPQKCQDAIWALYDAGLASGSLLIASQEPYIPWELLIPTRKLSAAYESKTRPLGAEFAIGRWFSTDFRPSMQQIKLGKCYVIAPPSVLAPLQRQKDETDYVRQHFETKVITPATLTSIESEMKTEQRELLHWCCHGSSDQEAMPGKQVIDLDDAQRLDSFMVKGMVALRSAIATKKPFIFLNACELGKEITGLGGIGGFAQTFMLMGASAIVAPLWDAEDEVAFVVAQTFYNAILRSDHPSFAEVLRSIRAKAYDDGPEQGKTTFTAYCYYGDPCAALAPLPEPSQSK